MMKSSELLLLFVERADAGTTQEPIRTPSCRHLPGARPRRAADSGRARRHQHRHAERADGGLGSFYSHFAGEPDLFDAAVADALEEYAQAVAERPHGVDDPAERLAGGVRLSARMAESYPEIMQILCHSRLGRICAGDGLAPRAKRDAEEGMAAGRFTVVDPVIALAVLNGSLLALLELWCNRPGPTAATPPARWPR